MQPTIQNFQRILKRRTHFESPGWQHPQPRRIAHKSTVVWHFHEAESTSQTRIFQIGRDFTTASRPSDRGQAVISIDFVGIQRVQ